MSLNGKVKAGKSLAGKIENIRQIADLTAMFNKVDSAIERCETATESANDAAYNAEEQTIYDATVSDSGDLLLICKNGREINAGNVKGEDGKDAEYSLVANAIKGNKSGNPIALSDVSPLPHEIKVNVDVNGATVQKYGKNLCWRSSITSGDHVVGQIDVTDVKAHGTYTLSADVTVFADDEKLKRYARIEVYYADGTSSKINSAMVDVELIRDGKPRKFTVSVDTDSKKEIKSFRLSPINYSGSGSVNNARADNIQLELSKTATEYEPYRNPEPLTADEEGNISIVGNGESMTLIAEDGVTMEAEYNRDINKAFAELQNAIISLGGNV